MTKLIGIMPRRLLIGEIIRGFVVSDDFRAGVDVVDVVLD